MKYRLAIMFGAISVALFGAVTVEAKPSADLAAITQQTHTWVQSWRTSPEQPFDLDAFSHLYAQDSSFSSFDFGRPAAGFQDWQSAQRYYRQFMQVPVRWWLKANNDLHITQHGHIAWATVSLSGGGQMRDGTTLSMPEARVTLIFEKRAGQWLIVHEHGSAALPFPSSNQVADMLGAASPAS